MSPDKSNIFGNKYPEPLKPIGVVPKNPTPSQLVEIPWVQLPLWVTRAVTAWMHEHRPGIKALDYHWNQHLTDDGRMSLLKQAGVD